MNVLLVFTALLALAEGVVTFTPEQLKVVQAVGLAHGVMACLAWVVFAPVGAVLLRTLPGRYALRAHTVWQTFTYVVFAAAVGLGIWLSVQIQRDNLYHPIIGLVVFGLATVQLPGGPIAHLMNRKRGHSTIVGTVHAGVGILAITLGMINGGVGLLYHNHIPPSEFVPYAVFTAIIWACFVAFALVTRMKRAKTTGNDHVSSGIDGTDTSEIAPEKRDN